LWLLHVIAAIGTFPPASLVTVNQTVSYEIK
jgi:hypothetical protein